ncbi:MAG: hypothetical protein JW834_02595 [Candidatus Diapherotrites archaeon]|nr:hypothetical protein [Candidatus Diapherotrites archaeon]
MTQCPKCQGIAEEKQFYLSGHLTRGWECVECGHAWFPPHVQRAAESLERLKSDNVV